MNGVEVLASNEVIVETLFNWKTFGIAFGGILALGIFVGFIFSIIEDMDWTLLKIGILVGVLFGGIIGTAIGFGCGIPVAYETQYKVTISDDVQMNCFFEKYEVLNQEGKIYTVRER